MFFRKYVPFSMRYRKFFSFLIFLVMLFTALVLFSHWASPSPKNEVKISHVINNTHSSFSNDKVILPYGVGRSFPVKPGSAIDGSLDLRKDSVPDPAMLVETQAPVIFGKRPYNSVNQANVGRSPSLMGYGYRRQIYPSQDHFFSNSYQNSYGALNESSDLPPFIPERRLVHFDLKGAPPTIEYLSKVFSIIRKLGATGVVMEYEDMFPYDGVLKSIAAHNHYTKEEVRRLLQLADLENLEVIPLIQTFGHMEFILKLEQFVQLRENPDVPQAVCPSRNDSANLIELVIDQVMEMHPNSKYIHIGCDEVYHIGECSLCSSKTKEELFLGHVTKIASYVRNNVSALYSS